MLGLLRIFMRHVEIDMILASLLHLAINSPGHDVTRCKGETWIVFLHELLATEITKHGSISTHSLRDQEAGTVARMVESRRMELDKLHVFDRTLCSIDHRDTIASSYQGIGGVTIDRLTATGRHHGDA